MNDLTATPQWKESELVVNKLTTRELVRECSKFGIPEDRIMYDKYYTDERRQTKIFKRSAIGNWFRRYAMYSDRTRWIEMFIDKCLKEFPSNSKDKKIFRKFVTERMEFKEFKFRVRDKRIDSKTGKIKHWRTEKRSIPITFYVVRESFISYCMQKGFGLAFDRLKGHQVEEAVERLQELFNNISSDAEKHTFDNYIRDWARQLIREPMSSNYFDKLPDQRQNLNRT